jgi:iron complex outermembrane receptor protein
MLTQQPNSEEKQIDESLKTMLNFDHSGEKTNYSFTGALLLNRLNYFNRLASIDSRNLSQSLVLKAAADRTIGVNTKLKVVLNNDLTTVTTNNYSRNETRTTTSVTVMAERNCIDRFGTLILIRELFDKNRFLIPDFSTGLQFRITEGKEHFLKANISRNSKLPTMNDLFWSPGGNPALKNEYALIYELTYEMSRKISSFFNLRSDLSLFRNNIKDMIQWHPGEYSVWTADNIQTVNSTGLEASFTLGYVSTNLTSRLSAGYSFTKATDRSSADASDLTNGKQLIYIPENQANASLSVNYRHFYSVWNSTMTGKRYTTVDNTKYLPGYFINNITTGIRLNLKENSLDVNFSIDNLFDINYQTIAYYPLPGRSFLIKFLIQIVK